MVRFILNHRGVARACFTLNACAFIALMGLVVPALFGIAVLGENENHRAAFLAFPLIALNMLTGIQCSKQDVFSYPSDTEASRKTLAVRFGALFNTGTTTNILACLYIVVQLTFMWGLPVYQFFNMTPGALEFADGRWVYNNHGAITEIAKADVSSAISHDVVLMAGVISGFVWVGVGVFAFLGWGRIPILEAEQPKRIG